MRKTLPFEEYRAAEGINFSSLIKLKRSPSHYWHSVRAVREDTPTLLLGRAVHAAVLEPSRFLTEFKAAPMFDKRTKEGRAQYEAVLTESQQQGLTLISQEEFNTCEAIAKTALQHPTISMLLEEGWAEECFFWTDEETGLPCKARVDFFNESEGFLIDLKTTQDASHDSFSRSIRNYSYHVQAAFYTDGVKAVTGKPPEGFILIALEKQSPYGIAFYGITDTLLQQGRNQYRSLLRQYQQCCDQFGDPKTSEPWPGYPIKIQIVA